MGLREYSKIHGHICFGLALGYRAGKLALAKFETPPLKELIWPFNNEIVVLSGSSESITDAIQLVTACTCHISPLLQDKGRKFVFIFYKRTHNRAIRLSAKPEIMRAYQLIAATKEKLRQKSVSKKETQLFWQLNASEVKCILELPDEELFDIEYFETAILVKQKPFGAVYVPLKQTR